MRAAGVTPDAKAWTALMRAHASAGDLHATADAYWRMRTEGVVPNEGTLGAALAAGRVGGGDVGALIAIYRDMRALDVRPNNRGFRQLTEMWVDQAFEPPSGGASGSVQTSDPDVVHPNFMLADVLGPEVDGPAESIASHESAVVSRDASDLSGSMSDSPMNSPMIDVHGLSVPETRAAVLSVLQALRERRKLGLPVRGNLVIVTGVGRRSPSEPPLRDAVVKLAGDLKLSVDVADDNPGRLVAREATLLAWLDRDRNETWSKERELVASVRVPRGGGQRREKSSRSPSAGFGSGGTSDGDSERSGAGGKAGGGGGGGGAEGRRYIGRRGRGARVPRRRRGDWTVRAPPVARRLGWGRLSLRFFKVYHEFELTPSTNNTLITTLNRPGPSPPSHGRTRGAPRGCLERDVRDESPHCVAHPTAPRRRDEAEMIGTLELDERVRVRPPRAAAREPFERRRLGEAVSVPMTNSLGTALARSGAQCARISSLAPKPTRPLLHAW